MEAGSKGGGGELGRVGRSTRGNETFGVMDMFIILIVVIVSPVCTYAKVYQIVYF